MPQSSASRAAGRHARRSPPMEDGLETRATLLVRIRDPHDAEAWQRFVDLYGPLVYRFVRQRGLQDADAADLTQEVFQIVARAARRLDYDPSQGTFRGYLYTITRHKLYDFLDKGRNRPVGSGNTSAQRRLEELPSPEDEEEDFYREHDRQLFHWAASQVRGAFTEQTWLAFWRTAVEGRSGQEVADELKMSVGAVYVARSRVLARLTKKIQEVQAGQALPGVN
jgi:RNA polymerase sigma-70 factor (ECF subfamily)